MIHGSTYNPQHDSARLLTLLERVRNLMCDQKWRSLKEIVQAVGGSEAGVSARLRQLRTEFHYTIEKRREGNPRAGLWVYRLTLPTEKNGQELFPGVAA